jgi:amino-acid N-acetyltransferase
MKNPKIKVEAVVLRKMLLADCIAAAEIIQNGGFKNSVLPVTPKQLMQRHRKYWVGTHKDKPVASCGYKVYPGGLVEIRSLVILEEYRKNGIGYTLVDLCLEEIYKKGYRSVIVLTRTPAMFRAKGFVDVDIHHFPQKLQRDCKFCLHGFDGPDDPRCNETALFLKL